jgi:hypothetical protein
MADKKRPNDDDRRDDAELDPFPGVTGEGAEPRASFGGTTEGLFGDGLDGTLGDTSERQREQQRERAVGGAAAPRRDARERGMTGGTSISPISDYVPTMPHAGTSSDIAGATKHGKSAQVSGSLQGGIGADDVGGMGTGTGRGRGTAQPGGVYGNGDSSGTGQMGGGFDSQIGTGGASGGLGSDIGGGMTGGTGGQGLPRRSDLTSTGGGVAVSAGRGSDVGTVGGGMEDELMPGTTGGMSGGTFGGSRESDLGGGLSGGMRSGMGTDVSGAVGDSDDEAAEGDRQRNPRRRD